MSGESFRREVRRLLGAVEAARAEERIAARQRAIARNLEYRHFEEARDQLVVPALRELMRELERRGHLTRLERRSDEKLRLHVQLQGKRALQAVVDAELRTEKGRAPRLRFAVVRSFQIDLLEEIALADLSEHAVAEVVVRCLSALAARAAS